MNSKLKLKIIWTNIKRVAMSILFVNLSFGSKVLAESNLFEVTCYARGPVREPVEYVNNLESFENVFIILVPLVFVIGLVIYIVKKHKTKSKKEENNDKQD